MSEYCFDYCFPGDEFGYKLTVLVGTERLTGMKFATAVPTKGSSGKFAVGKALEFLADVGDMDGQIIIRNDQEPSINILSRIWWRAGFRGGPTLRSPQLKAAGAMGWLKRGYRGSRDV